MLIRVRVLRRLMVVIEGHGSLIHLLVATVWDAENILALYSLSLFVDSRGQSVNELRLRDGGVRWVYKVLLLVS